MTQPGCGGSRLTVTKPEEEENRPTFSWSIALGVQCGGILGAVITCNEAASGSGGSSSSSRGGSSDDDEANALLRAIGNGLRKVLEDMKAAAQGDATTASSGNELPGLATSRAQIEAKFKHAADFGVNDVRGASGFNAYAKSVDAFVRDSSTVRTIGTYRGNPAILNYSPSSRLVVVQSPDGAFVSGWRMSEGQFQNVILKRSLGGG
jgi:hypothetical protein